MTDYALVAATLLADDVDPWGMPVLRAVLPVAGMTVIEQQGERLRSCGISTMLIHVDAVPAALAQACERMRGRGVDCRLVRTAGDVLAMAADADRLLLVADGLIADALLWRQAANAEEPTVLVAADGPMTSALERIDATTRWAGLAMVDRGLIDGLDGVPDDWDPQLVLFRNALQGGARLVECDQSMFVAGDVVVAETPAEAAGAEQRLMASNAAADWGVVGRWVIASVINVAGGTMLARQDSGKLLRLVTPLAAMSAAAGAVLQMPWVMAAAGVVAAVSDQAARFVAGFRPEARIWRMIGRIGVMTQFLALAIADRAITLASADRPAGSGGMTISIILLLSMILHRKLPMPAGRLVDFPAVWLVVPVLVPMLGWRGAFDAVGMAAAVVLAAVLLQTAGKVPTAGGQAV